MAQDGDYQQLLSLLQKSKSLEVFRNAFEKPEDLQEFADRARISNHEQGEQLIKQGDHGDFFFIVLDGQLRAVDVEADPPHLLNYHTAGDIIGLNALLGDRTRKATVEVVVPAKLAFYDEDDWSWLLGKNSQFKTFFEDLEKNRIQQAMVDFPGKQWDEVVVISTKRHLISYIATLPIPIALLIAPILFLFVGSLFGLEFVAIIGDTLGLLFIVPFVLLAALLAVYNYFDWRNDDFIVTTKRVIHIERYLFFGEQRNDAPLTRIQDVTAESDFFDYLFDTDNLVITTAGSGVIRFDHIRRADHLRQHIFQERARAKARVAAADVAALRHNLAKQLDWDGLEENVMAVAEPEAYLVHEPPTRHYGRVLDYLIPRMKEVNDTGNGVVVIWRKHYYVLFINTILPLIALLASIYFFLASFFLWLPPFTVVAAPIQFGLALAILASFIWYLWEYDDWNKDVYMVTNTQIIDIESAAFRLRRTRREGTFDNIQAVYSEIPDLFHKLLNMGNVIIETAGTKDTFTFKNVFDPASVTKEVFNRWSLYQQREREARRDATHGQVMEVLTQYHKLNQRMHQS
jgi:uncharacterized membrane protein YdbT with pleckstrin-like domain